MWLYFKVRIAKNNFLIKITQNCHTIFVQNDSDSRVAILCVARQTFDSYPNKITPTFQHYFNFQMKSTIVTYVAVRSIPYYLNQQLKSYLIILFLFSDEEQYCYSCSGKSALCRDEGVYDGLYLTKTACKTKCFLRVENNGKC